MPPESAKYLHEMLEAARAIAEYTHGKSADDFLQSRALRDAVQWNFAVIGEALSQLKAHDSSVASQISEWKRIIAFRNQLIHSYGVIQSETTWNIIAEKLPVLVRELESLLNA